MPKPKTVRLGESDSGEGGPFRRPPPPNKPNRLAELYQGDDRLSSKVGGASTGGVARQTGKVGGANDGVGVARQTGKVGGANDGGVGVARQTGKVGGANDGGVGVARQTGKVGGANDGGVGVARQTGKVGGANDGGVGVVRQTGKVGGANDVGVAKDKGELQASIRSLKENNEALVEINKNLEQKLFQVSTSHMHVHPRHHACTP